MPDHAGELVEETEREFYERIMTRRYRYHGDYAKEPTRCWTQPLLLPLPSFNLLIEMAMYAKWVVCVAEIFLTPLICDSSLTYVHPTVEAKVFLALWLPEVGVSQFAVLV